MRTNGDVAFNCGYLEAMHGMDTDLKTIDGLLQENSELGDREQALDVDLAADFETMVCENASLEGDASLEESLQEFIRAYDGCALEAEDPNKDASPEMSGDEAVCCMSAYAADAEAARCSALAERHLQQSTLDAAAIVPRLFLPCVQNGEMPPTLTERMQQYEIAAGAWNDVRGTLSCTVHGPALPSHEQGVP